MKKWKTIANGFWRVYKRGNPSPGFVLNPRYAGDEDYEARVQIVTLRGRAVSRYKCLPSLAGNRLRLKRRTP